MPGVAADGGGGVGGIAVAVDCDDYVAALRWTGFGALGGKAQPVVPWPRTHPNWPWW